MKQILTTRKCWLSVVLIIVFAVLFAFAYKPNAGAGEYRWRIPEWLPKPIVPADNPMSDAKVELGRRLFYDKRLSVNGMFSCASCHQQSRAFADDLPVAQGATGQRHPRNAQTLANVAYLSRLTWASPTLKRLEKQMLIPLLGVNPIELGMAGKVDEILSVLADDTEYRRLFALSFPMSAPIALDNLAKAIAAFERTLISANAPFDHFCRVGKTDAISPAAKRGADLFFSERLQCFQCHGGLHFVDTLKHSELPFEDFAYHNTGLYDLGGGRYPKPNTGLHHTTGRSVDMGRFRTPSLRNIAATAPYMHDGSVPTLAAVIDLYAAGGRRIVGGPLAGDGRRNPNKSVFVRGFALKATEKADLLEFLDSLTDTEFLTDPRFSDPFSAGRQAPK